MVELKIKEPHFGIAGQRAAAEGEVERLPLGRSAAAADLKHRAAADLWAEVGADERVVGVVWGGSNHGGKPFGIDRVVGVFREDLTEVDRNVGQPWFTNTAPLRVCNQHRHAAFLEHLGKGRSHSRSTYEEHTWLGGGGQF